MIETLVRSLPKRRPPVNRHVVNVVLRQAEQLLPLYVLPVQQPEDRVCGSGERSDELV